MKWCRTRLHQSACTPDPGPCSDTLTRMDIRMHRFQSLVGGALSLNIGQVSSARPCASTRYLHAQIASRWPQIMCNIMHPEASPSSPVLPSCKAAECLRNSPVSRHAPCFRHARRQCASARVPLFPSHKTSVRLRTGAPDRYTQGGSVAPHKSVSLLTCS